MRVTRYPKLRERLPPALAGRLVNELRKLAIVLEKLPTITLCHDPYTISWPWRQPATPIFSLSATSAISWVSPVTRGPGLSRFAISSS